jgi:glycosyltransferase involved in cell wall biosynthesis
MKALHITFRYGTKVYGGAEYYLRKLSQELYKLGIDIDICTTKSDQIKPLFKYGVIWDNLLDNKKINELDIFRFPVKNPNRYISLFFEKIVKNKLEEAYYPEEKCLMDYIIKNCSNMGCVLLDGWHIPEKHKGSKARWTKKEASILLNDLKINWISIFLLNIISDSCQIIIKSKDYNNNIYIPKKDEIQEVNIALPRISGKIHIIFEVDKTEKYFNDPRELGIKIYGIKYQANGHDIIVDLEEDYRTTLIYKKSYINYLTCCAKLRQRLYGNLFDYMRGPESPHMLKWLDKNIYKYDIIMAAMFPFNTIKYSMTSKKYNKPLVLLPLMHVDDPFYHWAHYYNYLMAADHILAISTYSQSYFFNKIGVKSTYVGAGVDKSIFIDRKNLEEEFRNKYGLQAKNIVLTVSRKQKTKRYDLIIEAMKKVRSHDRNAHLVMIGPDDDQIPIRDEGISYLGTVSEDDLLGAYDSCDAFSMMSMSESFGMVFCEAWSRKKPVIGNINCGPVSTLIDDGIDGFLCDNSEDLAEKIMVLINDQALSKDLGKKGFIKVINDYTWDRVANKTYLIYKQLSE